MATAGTNLQQTQWETIVLPLLVVQPIDRLSFADLQIRAHPNCIQIGRPFVNYSQLVEIDDNETVSVDCDNNLQFCGFYQSAAKLLNPDSLECEAGEAAGDAGTNVKLSPKGAKKLQNLAKLFGLPLYRFELSTEFNLQSLVTQCL